MRSTLRNAGESASPFTPGIVQRAGSVFDLATGHLATEDYLAEVWLDSHDPA
jgi:hypothetical protein